MVDLLKKLDNETKHKLVLEKELKEIRYTLMRTTSGSSYNIHSSNLNNFSFTDRQDKTDTKNLSTDREKELS